MMPDKVFLRKIFDQVDTDRSGSISVVELQSALSNGTWTPFNPETVRMMIGMFDKDGSSNIEFNEFEALWRYVKGSLTTNSRVGVDSQSLMPLLSDKRIVLMYLFPKMLLRKRMKRIFCSSISKNGFFSFIYFDFCT
ncbi:hypothetical protein ACOME3_001180 [Neoechinorhynchus agilis]